MKLSSNEKKEVSYASSDEDSGSLDNMYEVENTGGAKVIVVDDDVKSQKLLSAFLRKDGFEVHASGDGLSALELIEKEQPDAVLLDILMPKMNGIEVCKSLNPDYSRHA